MTKLPPPPPEIPASTDMLQLAPLFAEKVFTVLADMKAKGHDAVVCEAFRSDERQEYLYGFGRDYDDGRGIVTQAPTGAKSQHRYGLAVDIYSASQQWDAPPRFWTDLRDCAVALNLTSGADWTHPDRPHVQHWCEGMHVTPSDHAWELLQSQGVEAVWKEVRAVFIPMAA
jgi:hypothetical protein